MILRELEDELSDWDVEDIKDAAARKGQTIEVLIHNYIHDHEEGIYAGSGKLLCKLSDGKWYADDLRYSSDGRPARAVWFPHGPASLSKLSNCYSGEELEEIAPLIKEAEAVEKDLATLNPLWGQK